MNQYYGGSHILRGVSFEAITGEVTCLLGRNGVGKTTLLKCLMGLIPAKTGEVIWQGKTITHSKPHQRVQSGVAYVPQGREIFPRLTVEENLLLGLSRFSAREAKQVPEEIWQLFPVLKEMKHRRGGDLSVVSSSSWRLVARWRVVRGCLSWMNRPKAYSLPLLKRSAT